MTRIETLLKTLNLPASDLWINEAKFGLRYVEKYLNDLPQGAAILEVGCGSGILLSMLSEKFPGRDLNGIEPLAEGFAALWEINAAVRNSGG